MSQLEQSIFQQGSTTYYWSSRFFPRAVRDDVFKLYSFVRVADDYVDMSPPDKARFEALCRAWQDGRDDVHFDTTPDSSDTLDQRVVKNMVHVHKKYGFDVQWTDAFLASMQADLDGKPYETLDDTLWYIYGSAEVIGLMMARIMHLSPETYEAARLQGRAMQFINFIRDLQEDYALGRCYFPRQDLNRFKLPDLSPATIDAHPAAFKAFITFQLERYHAWQSAARHGFRHIPRQPRAALKTAVDMYDWTGSVIASQPNVVFSRKIKPSKAQVLRAGVRNILRG